MTEDCTALMTEQLMVNIGASDDHHVRCGTGSWYECPLRAEHAWSGHRVHVRMLELSGKFVDRMVQLAAMPGESPESLAALRAAILRVADGCRG